MDRALLTPALLGPDARLTDQPGACAGALPHPSAIRSADYALADGGWLEVATVAWPTAADAARALPTLPARIARCTPGAQPFAVQAATAAPAYGQQSYIGEGGGILTSGAPFAYYLGIARSGPMVSVLAIRNAKVAVSLSTYDQVFALAVARLLAAAPRP